MEHEINLAFDIETDGIDSTKIHCIVTQDLNTGLVQAYNNEKYTDNPKDLPMGSNYSITTGISSLEVATNLISHNGMAYDTPQIRTHYPYFQCKGNHWDTLILSRFFHPNLLDIDLKRKWSYMPARLYGSHSLEAYGYRLKCYKGEFCKNTDWKEWSQEMQDYCQQDVTVLTKLWEHFRKYLVQSF